MLSLVQAAGAVRGWADAVMVDATRALFDCLRPVATGGPAAEAELGRTARSEALARARALTVDEVEAATGAGRAQCQKLVGFATAAPARTAAARAAMRGGRCEFYRAQIAQRATDELAPELADGIVGDVLGPRPDGTCWSHRQFRARLRRRVLRHQDPKDREKTHERAVAERGAWATMQDDGTGELDITGDAPRVVAARERLEALARALRRQGDLRTLDQLRSDVALDLLTHGTVPPLAERPDPVTGCTASRDPWAVYRAVGDLPPAQVALTVPLDTLLGLREGIGELVGYGPIDAEQGPADCLRARLHLAADRDRPAHRLGDRPLGGHVSARPGDGRAGAHPRRHHPRAWFGHSRALAHRRPGPPHPVGSRPPRSDQRRRRPCQWRHRPCP